MCAAVASTFSETIVKCDCNIIYLSATYLCSYCVKWGSWRIQMETTKRADLITLEKRRLRYTPHNNTNNISVTGDIIKIWRLDGPCLPWIIVLIALLSHFSMLLWSVTLSLGIPCLCSHVILLSFSHHQGQKVATCLFITCPRSSEMRSSCKCFCLLATSSLPKSLWTEQPIRANVLVSQKIH